MAVLSTLIERVFRCVDVMHNVEIMDSGDQKPLNRRGLLFMAVGLSIAVPAALATNVMLQRNLLPTVAEPSAVMVDGWVLDERDLSQTVATFSGE